MFCESAANYFGHHYGAVASAGAAECDGEIIFSFGDIVRNQIGEQAFELLQENFRLRKRADVTSDAGIFAAETAELGNEMRIGEEADIENEIGVGGNAVTETETDDGDDERLAIGILETLADDVLELVDVEFRSVDDDVGEAANGRHFATLFANAFADGKIAADGMRAACFAEAAHENGVAGFDEDEDGVRFFAELAINFREFFELLAFAGVNAQRGTFDFTASLHVKLAESGNE